MLKWVITALFLVFILYVFFSANFNSDPADSGRFANNSVLEDKSLSEDSGFKYFSREEFESAKNTKTPIILYFYSNWCTICLSEFPVVEEAANRLGKDKFLGFRVNFNDDDTDEEEKNIARDMKVYYQYTKVFIINGEVVLKDGDPWDKAYAEDKIVEFLTL